MISNYSDLLKSETSDFSRSKSQNNSFGESKNRGQVDEKSLLSENLFPLLKKLSGSSFDGLRDISITLKNLRINQPLQTRGSWRICLENELKIDNGAPINAKLGVFIVAKQINQFSSIVSGQKLSIQCQDIKRGSECSIEAKGTIALNIERIDNSNNVIVSKSGNIYWNGQKGALFDNTHGKIEAKGIIDFASTPTNTSNRECILLNDHGLIISEDASIKAQLSFLSNQTGRIAAPNIALKTDRLLNVEGEIFSNHLIDIQTQHMINGGLIFGRNLKLRAQELFYNSGGIIHVIERGELKARSLNLPDGAQDNPLLGMIVSKKGDLLIASEAPFSLCDHLTACQQLQVVVNGSLTNHPDTSIYSEQGEIHFIQSASDRGIYLKQCDLKAKRVLLQTERGSIELDNISGDGALDLQPQGDILFNSSTWRCNESGIFVLCPKVCKAEFIDSTISGNGVFQLQGSSSVEDELCKNELKIDNSTIELKEIEIDARKFVVQRSKLISLASFTASCGRMLGEYSKIKSGDRFAIKALDEQLLLKDVIVKARQIILHAEQGPLKGERVALWSEEDLVLRASSSNACVSGSVRAGRNLSGFASKLMVLCDLVAQSGDEFNIFAKSLTLANSNFLTFGNALSFQGEEEYLASNSTLMAPNGEVCELSLGQIEAHKVQIHSKTHFAQAQKIDAIEIDSWCQTRFDQIADAISLKACTFTARKVNQCQNNLARDSISSITSGNIAARNLLAISLSGFRAEQIAFSSQDIELKHSQIASDNTSFEAKNRLQLDHFQVTSESKNQIEDGEIASTSDGDQSSAFLRACNLSISNCSWRVKRLILNGGHVALDNVQTLSHALHLRAQDSLAVFQSSIKAHDLEVKSNHSGEIAESFFDAFHTQIAARDLKLNQSILHSRSIELLGENGVSLNRATVATKTCSIESENVELSNSALIADTLFSIKARFLNAHNVRLEIEHGDANVQVDFATLNDLLAVVGKDLTVKSTILRALTSQLFIANQFNIHAKDKLEIISSLVQAQDLSFKTHDISFIASHLQARRDLLVRGVQALWSSSDLIANRRLRGDFQRLNVLGGEQKGRNLELVAEQLNMSGSVQLALKFLELDAAQLNIEQAVVRGDDVSLNAAALTIAESVLQGDEVALTGKVQRVTKSIIRADYWFKQTGRHLLGIENQIIANNQLQMASQSIVEEAVDRPHSHISIQMAPWLSKMGGQQKAGLIFELALQLKKSAVSQSSTAMLAFGGLIDIDRTLSCASEMMLITGWQFRANYSQFCAPQLGSILSLGGASLFKSVVQGSQFRAQSLIGSLKIQDSQWQVKDLDLRAEQNLELARSTLATESQFAMKAGRLMAENSDFKVAKGDANLQVESAHFDGSTIAAGKNLFVKSDLVKGVASGFFAADQLSIKARDQAKIHASSITAQNVAIQSPELTLIATDLQGQDSVCLSANKGLLDKCDITARQLLKGRFEDLYIEKGHQKAATVELRADILTCIETDQAASKTMQMEADQLSIVKSVVKSNELFLNSKKKLDLTKSKICATSFKAFADSIHNNDGEILGHEVELSASMRVDNQGGTIQGLFKLTAPLIKNQNGLLIPNHGTSEISTADLQSDEKSLFVGFGDLNIDLQNDSLKGRFSVEGINIKAQNPQFDNQASFDSDRLAFSAAGNIQNNASIIARSGQIEALGDLVNGDQIAGQERFSLNVAKLNQIENARIASDQLSLHQRQEIKTSQLGPLFGNRVKKLTSDQAVIVDKWEMTPGALTLANDAKTSDVKTLAPVIAGKSAEIKGRQIELHDRFHAGSNAQLQSDAKVTTHARTTVGGDFEVFGDEYFNDAGQVEVQGKARAKVKRFINQTQLLGANDGDRRYRDWDANHPDARAYPTKNAHFKTEKGWEIDAQEVLENRGGTMLTAGDAIHLGVAPHGYNITHDYNHNQYVGDKQKFRFHRVFTTGSVYKNIPVYENRTQIVVDSPAILETHQNLVLNDLTGDLINEGVIQAERIFGRVANLTLKLLNERGRAPEIVEPKTGLPLATMRAQLDIDLQVSNKATIEGRLQAGSDLNLVAQNLDVERRRVIEQSALIRKGGILQSDSVRFENAIRVEGGAEIFAGGNSRIRVLETANLIGADFKAGGDLQVRARNAHLLSQDEIRRVDLPGKSSIFRARDQHALHRHFNPSQFQAGGIAHVIVDGHLVNEAAQISGLAGALLKSRTADHRVLSTTHQVRSDRRAFRSADQYRASMKAPLVTSSNGPAGVKTTEDLTFTGHIIAGPNHTAFAASQLGSVTLPVHLQELTQRESKTRANFLSITSTRERREESAIIAPVIAGGNVVITAKKEIMGEGLQLNAIKTIALKAEKVSLKPHYQKIRIKKRGATLGVSFSGFSILENLIQGQSLDDAVNAALLSDPAIGSSYALIKAKTGEERAYRGLKAAAAYWQAANSLSLSSSENQPLSTFIGQRAKILNQEGEFAPKMTIGLEAFEDVREISDVYLCQLSAGEQILIEAAEQEYTATEMSAPSVALTGDRGQKAKSITLQSALSTIYQENDALKMGFEFQVGQGASSSPTDLSLAINQSDSN